MENIINLTKISIKDGGKITSVLTDRTEIERIVKVSIVKIEKRTLTIKLDRLTDQQIQEFMVRENLC